jgi:S-adenosylmethionine hydrolase
VIATFTDFGVKGPYLGQVKALLCELAPGVPVVDVFPDMPACNVKSAAYLLPAYAQYLAKRSICLCVVDPGVGTERRPVALRIDERWYVGPDNGMFSILLRRAKQAQVYEITWRPDKLSHSFHGRDLFAPVCAKLASGESVTSLAQEVSADSLVAPGWQDDLFEIAYIDGYGNLITGVRASVLSRDQRFEIGNQKCCFKRVFAEASDGAAFWYENSNGLAEIAVANGSAQDELGIGIGEKLCLVA